MVKRLILIFGDQLTENLASLREADRGRDIVVMGELRAEANYVRHHKKKIALIFSAMRHFAADLEAAGWRVDYQRYDADDPAPDFTGLMRRAIARHGADSIVLVEPGEWRLIDEVQGWRDALGVDVAILDDDRFICSHREFAEWAGDREHLRMEYFYRDMRRKTGLLMRDGEPEGGRWNYDKENRKPAPGDIDPPTPAVFPPDKTTRTVLDLVAREFAGNFGDLEPFRFAVTRADAEEARTHFMKHALPKFGDYQDAMVHGEDALYHSLLSPYINTGLLNALETCSMAAREYENGNAPLNAVEGFIRQIIGWREFVRGVYWREGPGYTQRNVFGNSRALPAFYWTGDTDMACVAECVDATRRNAYAHHIQRLMVTGVFALIAGVDPHAVHEWYLEVYADAYEWVEAPNVIGMSQFADGGVVASKPYAASGAYINKMSDYCQSCRYRATKKTEADACPFNALYWDFLVRNRELLDGNQRLGRVFANWDRMDASRKKAYRARAQALLRKLDAGERI